MCLSGMLVALIAAFIWMPVQAAETKTSPNDQEKVAGTPIDDLSNAHDYATVDIKTLNVWERTFVPEARKKEIFHALLNSVEWKQHMKLYDREQKKLFPVKDDAFCRRLLSDLKSWKNVEIVEPEFSANRYVVPAFDDWRQSCPKLVPHDGFPNPYLGTHNFKSFRLPELGSDERLFYVQGYLPKTDIDAAGRLKPESSIVSYILSQGKPFMPDGSGTYSIINLKQCKRTVGFGTDNPRSFEYFTAGSGLRYSDSALVRINGHPYLVSGSASYVGSVNERRFFRIFDFKPTSQRIQPALCKFDIGFKLSPELYRKD